MLENDPKYASAQPLGLNERSIGELNKVVQPTLVELVEKQIGL